MEPLKEASQAEGLVLSKYHTAFYGTFSEGKPEGNGTAIQTAVVEEPRYSYAKGNWTQGKLNGEGETGYRYYETVPAGGYAGIKKTGTYSENLLEGPFVYEAEDEDGNQFFWDMEASAGVTVLTDSWTYSEAAGTYSLSARENPDRTYVLEKDQAEAVLWNNLILWEE